MPIDKIAQDCARAEITCAWVQERQPGGAAERHVLVVAVAELCPGGRRRGLRHHPLHVRSRDLSSVAASRARSD